jgi:hypothetical protein
VVGGHADLGGRGLWVFLGAGLYGLAGCLYRQTSVESLNPRTWDYVWSGFLLLAGLGGVAGVSAFWPSVLILAGVAYLVSGERSR